MIPGARSAPHVALCERGQALSSSEAVLRRCTLIGGAVPTLSKPTADRRLCGSGPDTLAERRGRSRTGSVQSRQLATANNLDPARLAMAAQSAALSSQRLVSRTGQPQRGPPAKNNHRGVGAKATGRALEIRDHRCRYRRRYDEGCLTTITPTSNPVISPGPDQSWRIQVDEP